MVYFIMWQIWIASTQWPLRMKRMLETDTIHFPKIFKDVPLASAGVCRTRVGYLGSCFFSMNTV